MLPRHVAIILDGNGRWAANRGLMREKGHFYGAENVPKVTARLFERGVEIVSLYALSRENLARPKAEVDGILDQILAFSKAAGGIFGGRARLVFSGDIESLPQAFRDGIIAAEEETSQNKPHTINILVNYGGRSEIIRAARLLSREAPEDYQKRFEEILSRGLPDPDLIIRTGGEKRLSGFMPYQSAYSELYFSDKLFPDFTASDVDAALSEYASRDRRFGKVH